MIDILGYIGTTLVIISFLCQSIILLRLLNICGAMLITIYAVVNEAWPVAILDGLIVVINVIQIIRYYSKIKV
ncbi:inner membrane protein [Volucribacter psittacicida]|uniref:Inner membrane protein n=1 Tax=Volucribacter psittacicida TaxID=203482 RepID=A0A4R1FMY6_9PAST|nr:YgjV family protein [Volucribacter psittacicida]TCJ94822.1 inner membrane protein [Volucribacter psittacicida]